MPSARACCTVCTRAVGVWARMTIACAPLEIMFSIAAIWAASSRSAVLTWNSLIERRDVRRLGVGLRHLDHLGAPDVADVGVGEGDVVWRIGQLLVLDGLGAGERLVAGRGIEATRGRCRLPGPRPGRPGGRRH